MTFAAVKLKKEGEKMIKKLSMLITAAVLSGMLPIMTCSASIFSGGDGSLEKPYLIANQEQLAIVADLPDLNYKLINDIELTEKWTTIGSLGDQFSGVFDGDGHKIMNASATLFKENKGIIKNLSIENTDIVEQSILVVTNNGTITRCFVSGKISYKYDTNGGIAASNTENGSIEKSSANVLFDDSNAERKLYMGGIVGNNYGTVSECFAIGNIKSQVVGNAVYIPGNYYPTIYNGASYTGGIAGYLSNGSISNCYADVSIISKAGDYSSAYAGGIAGYVSENGGVINNTYARGSVSATNAKGGICGYKSGGTITNSFYDRNTTGCTDTGKGIPKTTLGMKMQSVYTDWDFDNVWGMSDDINDGYPYLRWQYADAPVDSAAVEITAASSTDSSLKFISRAEISGEPDISTFGTTFIPLSLFEDDSAKSVNVVYDNDEYNIKNGQTYGATLTGIPEQCRDWQFVGKSYIKDSNRKYVWSAAKSASINDTALQNVE